MLPKQVSKDIRTMNWYQAGNELNLSQGSSA